MAATVNGVTLAALFYHHQSSPNDQEGFLFGKIIHDVEDTISDTQINNAQLQTTIYITDFQPWNKDFGLYSSNGYLDKGMLESILQGREKEVIGWYGCRRNTTMRVSMKEATIHRNLLSSLKPEYPDDFLFLLSTNIITTNLSTHSFDHALYRFRYGRFGTIKVNILNLGDTTHTHYKKQSPLSVNHRPDTLQTTFSTFRNKFENSSGEMLEVRKIRELSHCLHQKLVTITSQVKESEQDLSTLEKEVNQLTLQLKHEENLKNSEKVSKDDQPCILDMDIDKIRSEVLKTDKSKTGSVPSDMIPNAYSIKLEELDNQVLDLERPSSSESKQTKKYDETWLDITIDPKTSTGITTQTTELQQTKTTTLQPKTTMSKQSQQTILTEQPRTSLSKHHQSGTASKKPEAVTTAKSLRSRTAKTNEVQTKSDPFAFVNSMLGKDGKPVDSNLSSTSSGQQLKVNKPVTNLRESSPKCERIVPSQSKVKEHIRTSSIERQTRHNKVQKTQSDTKQDIAMEDRIERARTQRAKTRTGQIQSRRSLSRGEDKKDTIAKDHSKTSHEKVQETGASEMHNSDKKCNKVETKPAKSQVKKEECLITKDDESFPSSSPVF